MLDFSEVLILLLNHQIIPLFFSPRTRSQVMFALLCHGRLAQYCCMVCPRFFVFVFSFVIVFVFVFVTKIALIVCVNAVTGVYARDGALVDGVIVVTDSRHREMMTNHVVVVACFKTLRCTNTHVRPSLTHTHTQRLCVVQQQQFSGTSEIESYLDD